MPLSYSSRGNSLFGDAFREAHKWWSSSTGRSSGHVRLPSLAYSVWDGQQPHLLYKERRCMMAFTAGKHVAAGTAGVPMAQTEHHYGLVRIPCE